MSIEILDDYGLGDSMTGFEIPVLSDGLDALGSVVDDIWDKLDDLPGFKQLGDVTKDFAQGPLRDFAKANPLGPTVMRAFTSMIMQGAGALAGPWAMMMTATLPGLAKGQSFEQALISENAYRVTEAVKLLSGGQLDIEKLKLIPGLDEFLPKQFKAVVDEVTRKAREFGLPVDAYIAQLGERAGGSAEAAARNVADQLGVRQDMAVQAFQTMLGQRLVDPAMSGYDLGSGRWLDPLGGATFSSAKAPPPIVFKAPVATSTTVQNQGLSRLRSALNMPQVAAPKATSTSASASSASFQATLNALRANQDAARAAVPAAPLPSYDRLVSPSGTEELSLLDAKSFWDKNKTLILVGSGMLLAGVGLYLWSRR